MRKFKDAEQLAFYMIDKLDDYDTSTAFVEKDHAVDLLKEFLEIDDHLQLLFVDIDSYEYDKEYLVTIYYNTYHKSYELSIEKAYNYSKEKYFTTDGFVLFQNVKNAKTAMVDMCMNPYGDIDGYDYFVFGEEKESHESPENKRTDKLQSQEKPKQKPQQEKVSPEKSSSDKGSSGKRKPPKFTLDKKGHKSLDDLDFDLDFDFDEEDEIEDEATELFDEMEKMEKKLQEVNDMFGEMERFRKLFRW